MSTSPASQATARKPVGPPPVPPRPLALQRNNWISTRLENQNFESGQPVSQEPAKKFVQAAEIADANECPSSVATLMAKFQKVSVSQEVSISEEPALSQPSARLPAVRLSPQSTKYKTYSTSTLTPRLPSKAEATEKPTSQIVTLGRLEGVNYLQECNLSHVIRDSEGVRINPKALLEKICTVWCNGQDRRDTFYEECSLSKVFLKIVIDMVDSPHSKDGGCLTVGERVYIFGTPKEIFAGKAIEYINKDQPLPEDLKRKLEGGRETPQQEVATVEEARILDSKIKMVIAYIESEKDIPEDLKKNLGKEYILLIKFSYKVRLLCVQHSLPIPDDDARLSDQEQNHMIKKVEAHRKVIAGKFKRKDFKTYFSQEKLDELKAKNNLVKQVIDCLGKNKKIPATVSSKIDPDILTLLQEQHSEFNRHVHTVENCLKNGNKIPIKAAAFIQAKDPKLIENLRAAFKEDREAFKEDTDSIWEFSLWEEELIAENRHKNLDGLFQKIKEDGENNLDFHPLRAENIFNILNFYRELDNMAREILCDPIINIDEKIMIITALYENHHMPQKLAQLIRNHSLLLTDQESSALHLYYKSKCLKKIMELGEEGEKLKVKKEFDEEEDRLFARKKQACEFESCVKDYVNYSSSSTSE